MTKPGVGAKYPYPVEESGFLHQLNEELNDLFLAKSNKERLERNMSDISNELGLNDGHYAPTHEDIIRAIRALKTCVVNVKTADEHQA